MSPAAPYADLQDTAELEEILTDCLRQEEDEGTIRSYGLRYLRRDLGLYLRMAFVDMSMEQATMREIMGSYLQIGAAALLLLLGVSILLARWATGAGGAGLAAAAAVPLRRLPRAEDAPDRHPLQRGAAGGRPPWGSGPPGGRTTSAPRPSGCAPWWRRC